LIDADLGGGVIKQRMARRGSGKAGGFRTIIVFRSGDRAVFVHGFAKSDLENVRPDELAALKKLAAEILGFGPAQLARAVASGALLEVKDYGEDKTIPQQAHGLGS
jgi:hypothetical protein